MAWQRRLFCIGHSTNRSTECVYSSANETSVSGMYFLNINVYSSDFMIAEFLGMQSRNLILIVKQNPFKKAKGMIQCVLFHPTRPFFFVAVSTLKTDIYFTVKIASLECPITEVINIEVIFKPLVNFDHLIFIFRLNDLSEFTIC